MTQEYTFIVGINECGKRIDQVLEEKLLREFEVGVTRSFLHKNIGNIAVNTCTPKKSYKVKLNDRISYKHKALYTLEPETLDIEYVYEDEDILVINKAAGVVVHPGHGHTEGTLVHGVLHKLDPVLRNTACISTHYGCQAGDARCLRPGIVHRLDKDCSGLLLIAKTYAAQMRLIQSFQARRVQKHYNALVHGAVNGSGEWDAPIGRHTKHRTLYTTQNPAKPKAALTRFVPVCMYGRDGGYTLLDIELVTGRTHQIRVHCAAHGHPIVGDSLYSRRKGKLEESGLALCARRLEFVHPTRHSVLSFEVGLPYHFRSILEAVEGQARVARSCS